MSGLSESSLDSTDATVTEGGAVLTCAEFGSLAAIEETIINHTWDYDIGGCMCGQRGGARHVAEIVNQSVSTELTAAREALGRVRALAETFAADDRESVVMVGQHLAGGAVLTCAEMLTAALDGPIAGGGV